MKNLHIAVVGAGIAGLACACFLAQHGHHVVLFEQFAAPKPLGSGLLLQPTGQHVLSGITLRGKTLASLAGVLGAPITRLEGETIGKKKIFSLSYGALHAHGAEESSLFGLHSLGMHRNALFSLLLEAAKTKGVVIVPSMTIVDVEVDMQKKKSTVIAENGRKEEGFDFVIDASGMRSLLMGKYAPIAKNTLYPYGALWGTFKDDGAFFAKTQTLQQRYARASKMMGILPVGHLDTSSKDDDAKEMWLSFFWNMKRSNKPAWENAAKENFPAFQAELLSFWKEAEPVISQMHSVDDFTFSTYRDIRLRQPFHAQKRIVFIGDCCHCTSPQLGQGANLALLDAATLSRCLTSCGDFEEAVLYFAKLRKKHMLFYQRASAFLTPFFQSDSVTYAIMRDLLFPWMHKWNYVRHQMIHTLLGLKIGVFTCASSAGDLL